MVRPRTSSSEPLCPARMGLWIKPGKSAWIGVRALPDPFRVVLVHAFQKWEVGRLDRKPCQRPYRYEAGPLRRFDFDSTACLAPLALERVAGQKVDRSIAPGVGRAPVCIDGKEVTRRAE